METQTIIVGICVFILVTLLIANVIVSSNQKKPLFCTSNICMILLIIFVILPVALIQAYSVQCMVTGGCERFVWIIVGVAVLLTLIYAGLFIYKILKQKQLMATEQES